MQAAMLIEEATESIRQEFRRRKAMRSYGIIAEQCGVNVHSLARFTHGHPVSASVLRRIAAWLDSLGEEKTRG